MDALSGLRVLSCVFSFASPWFLSIDNFLNIGRQTTLVSIVAIGMTFVIIAGQIDLSVASTLALSGMAAALAMAHVANYLVRRRVGRPRHGRAGRAPQRGADHAARHSLVPRHARHAERRARSGDDGHRHQARHHHQRALFPRSSAKAALFGLPAPDRLDAGGDGRRRSAAALQHLWPPDLRSRRQSDGALFIPASRSSA